MKKTRASAKIAIERLVEESSICKHWMTKKVYTVTPTDSLAVARELLERHHINQLPVVSSNILLGIVTDRDLRSARNATPSGKPAKGKRLSSHSAEITVAMVMSRPAIALVPHSTLVNAASVMRQERIGAVPIVSGHTVIGIVTRSDILDAFVAYANDIYSRT
jgi:CBS domain-containing protein